MRQIVFDKFHALGNDFVVIDLVKTRFSETQKEVLSRLICDRHTGIGADGVVFFSLLRGRITMRIFNADGGEAELSGNGLRILAHYLLNEGITNKRTIDVYSSVGRTEVVIRKRSRRKLESSAFLPAARFETEHVPMRSRKEYFINSAYACEAGELTGTAVNVGNPHMVFFVDNFDFDWRRFGRMVERAEDFPEDTNVEFAQIKNRRSVNHRIWERGAGETSASGSGAAAVAAAGVMNGLLEHEVTVHEPAGAIGISIASLGAPIMISGPTTHIGHGTFIFAPNA